MVGLIILAALPVTMIVIGRYCACNTCMQEVLVVTLLVRATPEPCPLQEAIYWHLQYMHFHCRVSAAEWLKIGLFA